MVEGNRELTPEEEKALELDYIAKKRADNDKAAEDIKKGVPLVTFNPPDAESETKTVVNPLPKQKA